MHRSIGTRGYPAETGIRSRMLPACFPFGEPPISLLPTRWLSVPPALARRDPSVSTGPVQSRLLSRHIDVQCVASECSRHCKELPGNLYGGYCNHYQPSECTCYV
ncbi:Defensin MGD-1 [Frankliniella fusca]|uniref:Defensin MGD-1 n=1 Tax=Frankliniella fusca TaxID=407009 RepID=A0AAE1L927_9NEOP|nr:Defensin MGD-1 [Frankliniella fusca]